MSLPGGWFRIGVEMKEESHKDTFISRFKDTIAEVPRGIKLEQILEWVGEVISEEIGEKYIVTGKKQHYKFWDDSIFLNHLATEVTENLTPRPEVMLMIEKYEKGEWFGS